MVSLRAVAVASAATAAFVLPAAAHAATTKSMLMGPPAATQKALGQATMVNAFFPSKLTINVGDTVKFVPAGFHTAGIPKKGGGALPAFVPTGEKAANQADAAGAPFWFNGQDTLGLNPAFMQPAFGKKLTYDGSKSVESGLPLSAKPKPMAVKFTKTGTFTVYCDLHPGMTATVKVRKKGARIPTAKQDAQATKKQASAALEATKGLEDTKPAANTIDLGVAAKGGVEYFGMVPANLTVPAGTTVKFQMTKGSFEAHTATFGPGNPETEPSSYLGVLAASFEAPAVDPRAAYPSDVTPVALNPALHGNGFWSSGVLDAIKASPQPESSSVRFDTPGTYTYYCLIHPFMRGTVTVQ